MALIEGVKAVQAALRGKAKGKNRYSAVTGFTQRYALFVHENLTAKHKVGQAKYLEAPARSFARELARIVREAYAKGKTVLQCLILACLRLQREAQLLCPVDTSALKASAFTGIDGSDANTNAAKAFNQSERIRQAGNGKT